MLKSALITVYFTTHRDGEHVSALAATGCEPEHVRKQFRRLLRTRRRQVPGNPPLIASVAAYIAHRAGAGACVLLLEPLARMQQREYCYHYEIFPMQKTPLVVVTHYDVAFDHATGTSLFTGPFFAWVGSSHRTVESTPGNAPASDYVARRKLRERARANVLETQRKIEAGEPVLITPEMLAMRDAIAEQRRKDGYRKPMPPLPGAAMARSDAPSRKFKLRVDFSDLMTEEEARELYGVPD